MKLLIRLEKRMGIPRSASLIFFLFLTSFAYFYNAGGGNQAARLNQTRAIVTRGTLYVEKLGFTSDDQIRINGHLYSSKAPGTSLLGVPPYAVFGGMGWLIGRTHPIAQNVAIHLTTIVTVGLPAALAMLALYLLLVGFGLSPPVSLLSAIAVGLGSNYFPYATMFFGHALAAAFGFLSFYQLWRVRELRQAGEATGHGVFIAALLSSASVVTEYPSAIIAAGLTIYLLLCRPTLRELGEWVAGGGIGVVVLAFYNTLAFSSPLALSYLNYQSSEHNTFPVHSQGVGGVSWPRLDVLKELIYGDTRGIIWFAPAIVLTLPGLLVFLWRRRDLWREVLLAVLMIVGHLAFNAGYGDSIRYWGGANSAGPRHLVPMMPFAGLLIALCLSVSPWLFGGFVLLSVSVGLVVTSVMPQVPMLYSKPFSQFLIPYFLDGRLSLHRGGIISRSLVTEDSIAYTWGKLLGIPGTWALVPLLLLTTFLVARITRAWVREGRAGERTRAIGLTVTGLFSLAIVGVPLFHQGATAQTLAGPGVYGRYHTDHECKGPLAHEERTEDLSFRYNTDDLRPFPDGFCGNWITWLEVSAAGEYVFQVSGGEATLIIDGQKVVEIPKKERRGEGRISLETGLHAVSLQAWLSVIQGSLEVRWKVPIGGPFDRIPAGRLTVTPDLVDREQIEQQSGH